VDLSHCSLSLQEIGSIHDLTDFLDRVRENLRVQNGNLVISGWVTESDAHDKAV
jgi:hypothetical protein